MQCCLSQTFLFLVKGHTIGGYVVNLYLIGISKVVQIRDAKKLRRDISDDPIIMDQMVNLVAFIFCTFGNFLACLLVAAHTTNNVEID